MSVSPLPPPQNIFSSVLTPKQFQIGDSVRIAGGPALVYKVIAVTGCMVTILIVNPQPDGQVMTFDARALRTLDQSVVEKLPS